MPGISGRIVTFFRLEARRRLHLSGTRQPQSGCSTAIVPRCAALAFEKRPTIAGQPLPSVAYIASPSAVAGSRMVIDSSRCSSDSAAPGPVGSHRVRGQNERGLPMTVTRSKDFLIPRFQHRISQPLLEKCFTFFFHKILAQLARWRARLSRYAGMHMARSRFVECR
jgi:hypothetical protein